MLGLVQGHTVFAIWLGKDLSALIRLILGGELTEYTEMMGRARSTATNRMMAQAAQMGADAIINVRYMTTSVGEVLLNFLLMAQPSSSANSF
ncbi:MAG: YbjQ family protein [Planctomycetota bacterium]